MVRRGAHASSVVEGEVAVLPSVVEEMVRGCSEALVEEVLMVFCG